MEGMMEVKGINPSQLKGVYRAELAKSKDGRKKLELVTIVGNIQIKTHFTITIILDGEESKVIARTKEIAALKFNSL